MPFVRGESPEMTGRGMRNEPYVEATGEFSFQGDSYVVRCTALWPYKDYRGNIGRGHADELHCHIDFMNVTQGTSGRFPNVWIPQRQAGDANLRRHSCFRLLRQLLVQQTPIPSPVYP